MTTLTAEQQELIEKEMRIRSLDLQLKVALDALHIGRVTERWNVGNEYLPFHSSASHVSPEYRAGWNDCYWMAQRLANKVESE